jgi:arylformamidase
VTPRLIDISMGLGPETPAWPGSPGITTSTLMSMAAGDEVNGSRLDMDVHCGTHVDAPLHFVADGATVEDVGLTPFVGSAWVADVPDATAIGAEVLERLQVPEGTVRLLLRTRNSLDRSLRSAPFSEKFVALTADGAQWVVDHGLRLIGIDYLSIQRFADPPDTHQILLGAGTAIVEGLDLEQVDEGRWNLICLPLKLLGTEGAPARAVLLEEGWNG